MTAPQSDYSGSDYRNWHSQITDAESGSARLLEALRGQFLRFAAKHGVTIRDAQILLMNGVRL